MEPLTREPLRKYRKSGLEHFINYVRELPAPSPRAIFHRLEELGYRGQLEARRAVALMAYRHVRRVKRLYLDGVKREQLLPKSNLLLMGPTGSGKTHLCELLFREILRLPTVIVDITTYSETGYVGQDPSTIVTRLLHAADDNPLLAAIGIVCLDEFDKIASGQNNAVFAGAGTTKDVTGMGVQRELLKMLEAAEVVVPLELSQTSGAGHVVISTGDMAFIAAGAFSGFEGVLRRRAASTVGFGRHGLDPDGATSSNGPDHVASFQAYGFLPELVARFNRVVSFAPLDGGTLLEILKSNVLEKLTREFEDEGFELSISDDVLQHLVTESLRRQTGARGLGATLTRHLERVAFESFAESPGGRIRLSLEGGQVQVHRDS